MLEHCNRFVLLQVFDVDHTMWIPESVVFFFPVNKTWSSTWKASTSEPTKRHRYSFGQTLPWSGLKVAVVVRSEPKRHPSHRQLSHAGYDARTDMRYRIFQMHNRRPFFRVLPYQAYGPHGPIIFQWLSYMGVCACMRVCVCVHLIASLQPLTNHN